jgi:hypothetical protein
MLQVAGLCHAGLLVAGASMPKAVSLRRQLRGLPPFPRRLFYVYFAFIGMILAGFGVLTFSFAEEIAAGQPLARALCALMALFWSTRLCVAVFVFDVRPYLTNWFYRLGNAALNLVFVYLVLTYALALWKGGRL